MSSDSTSSETFDEIHQVVLDGIIDNMASLVESVIYRAINTIDTSTNRFYVIMFASSEYTLQGNTTIDGQIITSGGLVVKAKYLCSMKIYTNWYCNQPKHNVITVPTRTILHPKLEVNAITYFHAIPTSVCSRTQTKKDISRQPIFLTDADYDYILEGIGHRDRIEFEREVDVYSYYMED